MGISRPIRLLGFLTAVLLVFLVAQILRTPSSLKPPKRPKILSTSGEFHDPNEDLIDEPPEPLHRISGNNYAPDNLSSDRLNATLLALVRNEELFGLLQSMHDLEATFNHKFNYPWTFFNDVPFTPEFKEAVRKATKADVRFELIPSEHWETPPWINQALYDESAKILQENGVQYAEKISYHQMCRWNSGFFHHHPALAYTQYYWRVEPNVHFFCQIDYDVFRYLRDHNKTYGFTINLYDSPESIPTLWPETQHFLADPENKRFVHPNAAVEWVTDAAFRPAHNKKANGYSTCHFWSNFEIAALDFWRSEAYTAYFNHLDRAGGFFYERWGDAPVHAIALGLFEDKDKIHWFRDVGYQHIPFFNCPRRPPGKCKGCVTGMFTDGEDFLYKEDCRPSWLDHVGHGDWAQVEAARVVQ